MYTEYAAFAAPLEGACNFEKARDCA